jgi:hypothetical protein
LRSQLAWTLLLLPSPALAQQDIAERFRLPTPGEEQCAYGPQDSEAVIVCGRRPPRGSYRTIPRTGDPEYELTERSWGSRVSENNQAAQWGDQTVGPFGYMQRSAQRNAEWREERRRIRARENYRGE